MSDSTSMDNQIDDIIRENKVYRFALEFQYATSEERKSHLKEILKMYEPRDKQIEENARTKLNKIFDTIEENSLKKKWSKLTLNQKKDRIKFFINNKKIKLTENNVIEMLENGTLKSTYVDYDSEVGVIKSIIIPEKQKDKKPEKIKNKI